MAENGKYKEDLTQHLLSICTDSGLLKGTLLDNGVMYRVLKEGSGTRKPTPRSIVYVPAHSTLIFEMELVKIER